MPSLWRLQLVLQLALRLMGLSAEPYGRDPPSSERRGGQRDRERASANPRACIRDERRRLVVSCRRDRRGCGAAR